MRRFDARSGFCVLLVLVLGTGCASIKRSDTARTGLEQLLVSSAIDRSLNKVDLRPIARAKVYVEEKYLDCVDKNYVLIALHQRLLAQECTLVAKAEEADVVLEVGSGGVGTDRQELYVGVPEISLPASQVSLPKVSFFERNRANGTAKLVVVAYDAKTRRPVINTAPALARSDHKNWTFLGSGPIVSGSVPSEIYTATGESESVVPTTMAGRSSWFRR